MSLISYIKIAQEKLHRHSHDAPAIIAPVLAANGPAYSPGDIVTPGASVDQTIEKYIAAHRHPVGGLSVNYDEATKTLVVRGFALDRTTREKIVLCCHRIVGVEKVDDRLSIRSPQTLESQYRASKPGQANDKIAKPEFSAANACLNAF